MSGDMTTVSMTDWGFLEAGEDGEDAVLELRADRLVAAHEVPLGEESVEVQPGVGEDEAGVVDGGHSSVQAGGQGGVLFAEYRS